MSVSWSGFLWGVTEEGSLDAYAFLGRDVDGGNYGDARGTVAPLVRCDIDCVGVELNYVGVEACRFEGVVTAFEVLGTPFARPPFALNLVESLAEIDLARKTWEGVRAKYLEKDRFDIGPGQLLLVLGATF